MFNSYISLNRNFTKCSMFLFCFVYVFAFKDHKGTTKPNRKASAGDDAGGSFTR